MKVMKRGNARERERERNGGREGGGGEQRCGRSSVAVGLSLLSRRAACLELELRAGWVAGTGEFVLRLNGHN